MYKGWQIGTDVDFAVGDFNDPNNLGYSSQAGINAAFATMIGDSSLIFPIGISCLIRDEANQELTSPLSAGQCSDGFTLSLDSSLGVNHSPSWSTNFAVGIEQSFGATISPFLGEMVIESNAALGSDLVWSNAFNASTQIGIEIKYEWEVTSTITYFIF